MKRNRYTKIIQDFGLNDSSIAAFMGVTRSEYFRRRRRGLKPDEVKVVEEYFALLSAAIRDFKVPKDMLYPGRKRCTK